MSEREKWLWIITGPNGAGKTSIRTLLPEAITALPLLNLDEYAQKLAGSDPYRDDPRLDEPARQQRSMERYLAASDQVMAAAYSHYQNGQSFATEKSVPSSGVYGKSFASLQADGWKIGVIAVGIKDAATARQRVEARIAEGGHDVPAVEATWNLCKEYTPAVLKIADRFMLYDNSQAVPQLIATKEQKYGPVKLHIAAANDYTKALLINTTETDVIGTRRG